ncbi:MAG: nucleotide exchange factor GrpE [Rhodospirillales bacterium]|jgi:molecular chaperone GrpE|nr:nucleotide exchange factor GrpE [Rhodospirillales bacterium]
MSTETEPKPGAPANDPAPQPEPDRQSQAGQPQTPEELMAAATARIAALEAEAADFKDRWMRAEAETANIRARARREVDETRQYAVQKFAADVVEAAENLRRGLDSLPAPQPDEPPIATKLREGFEGVERSFLSLLERNGIRKDDPTGQKFDPNFHQAMAEQESLVHEPGTVIQSWTPAWTLNGRLLRPAMVVVAKAPVSELSGARDSQG